MKSSVLVSIVEGHSEVEAVPVLLRRLLFEKGRYEVKIARPLRVGRYKVVRSRELERVIELARNRPEGCAAMLILLDADDDCPKELAPILRQRAKDASLPMLKLTTSQRSPRNLICCWPANGARLLINLFVTLRCY